MPSSATTATAPASPPAVPPVTMVPSHAQLRARKLRRNAIQVLIVGAVLGAVLLFCLAVRQGLAEKGIGFSFDFLTRSAGFEISEGFTTALSDGLPSIARFSSGDTNAQALVTGLFNTLKVAILSIVLATLAGTLLGIGRLSTNWLVRQLCFGLVEFVRNTPLLIQLTFWYIAVVLKLPAIASATSLFDTVIFSRQGIYMPAIVAAPGAASSSVLLLVAAAALLAGAAAWRGARQVRIALLVGGLAALAATFALGFPLALDHPEVGRFRASGGTSLSPELTALILAISVNSAAYIGEVVRGAIESLPRGQWEAASSLGLDRSDTLKEIILPQVFRVVLPSFGNQYIGLAKNTSLGIAIGFPDLFNVYGTVANQTGRSLEGILIVMGIYLLMSWTISAFVNSANNRLVNRGGTR